MNDIEFEKLVLGMILSSLVILGLVFFSLSSESPKCTSKTECVKNRN